MKVCESCRKHFEPSSNHKNCPSCRYRESKKVTCSICNIHKHSSKYKNCRHCTNKLRGDYGTGRYKRPNGYIMVFQKDHPRASKNYVFEHIVTMERHLGRFLAVGETVHHKNGIRHDNSIENLELWIKAQPSGVRAKDALAWARKVIHLYEPLEKKL